MEFYTYRLPNGIRGIHRQTKSNVTHCALIVNSGSRDEQKSEYGLAHFTEHALFKGTKNRKAWQVNCRLENFGGELNAFTTKEDITIHATTLKSDFRRAVELIADVSFNSLFPEKEIEREREVIYDEINTYKDSHADMVFENFEDMLFADSELGHNILGSKRTISKFSGDSIRNFVERTHTTDEMVFSSIGNISYKNIEKIVAGYFGDFAPSTRNFERVVPCAHTPFEKTVSKHAHQSHCVIGNRAYSICEEKRLPQALLINILGGPSANSMLNVEIREKHGLSYNIEGTYTPYGDSGFTAIYFSSDHAHTDHCLELVTKQIDLLKAGELTSRRFSMAKRQFVAQLAISMESNEGYMLGAGKSFLSHNDVDTMEQVYNKISEIKAADIVEVANEIFYKPSQLIYK